MTEDRGRSEKRKTCNLEPATFNLQPSTFNPQPRISRMDTNMGTDGDMSTREKQRGLVPRKAGPVQPKAAFTLIEMLAVIAIIMILAAILVPVVGKTLETARKRRAVAEMNAIKVAVMQFYSDHKYMPWTEEPKMGDDKWVLTAADQLAVMNMLTGSNAMRKAYLQIPEKSRPGDKSMRFLDPWSSKTGIYTFYAIGMDRNMDNQVLVQGTGVGLWEGKTVKERVLVYPTGDPEEDQNKRLKTFDVQ